MKHRHSFFLILTLLIIQAGCGGGGGDSSTSGSYRTNVQIVVGQTRTVSHETGTLLKDSAEIPSSVANIRFTISAPDMGTILRVISVAGRTTITESFEVPVGPNRRFLVEALDSAGNVIFRGDIFADVGQQPLSLTVSTVNTDPIAPIFAGLTTITEISTTSLVLNWSPATDNVTPQSKIQYLVFMSTTPGGESLSTPTFTTGAGATSYSVTGLSPSTAYYFIVRAKDEIGNTEANQVEGAATTLTPPDLTAPSFHGLGSATAVSETRIDLSWSAASDLISKQSNIVYLIYEATTSGGESFATPTFTTAGGATSYTITGLNSSTPYFFVVRARDEAGNIDQNIVEKSARTPDGIPPAFGGLSSAVALSPNSIQLSWSPATDNASLSGNIVYLIYKAASSGGQNFSSPDFTTSAGATSYTITGLNSSTSYFFVVRARDEASNIDQNILEKSARTPDGTPPAFGGLSSAVALSPNSIQLSWSPATDNASLSGSIVYLIYKAASSGGQNFSSPDFTTSAGATSYTVAGLGPSTTYFFVVRARDEAGNIDQNIVEKSARTPDGTPPVFGGLSYAVAQSHKSIQLSWSPATDDTSPSGNIVYLIYMATSSGGQNFSSPNFTTSAGAISYTVTGLNPSTTYFFVVRAQDEAGNVDKNSVEIPATTQQSVATTLSNPVYSLVGLNDYPDPLGGLPFSTYSLGFDYSDINGDANAESGATLRLQAQFPGGAYYDMDATSKLNGINGYSGTVHFNNHIRWDVTTQVVETITLTDGGQNISNAIQYTINRPEGAN